MIAGPRAGVEEVEECYPPPGAIAMNASETTMLAVSGTEVVREHLKTPARYVVLWTRALAWSPGAGSGSRPAFFAAPSQVRNDVEEDVRP